MKLDFKPRTQLLKSFLNEFWFAPQDVLLRSVEASIVRGLPMKHPILDVGIGDASIADLFYPKALKIEHGVDLDAEGIKRAKDSKKYKKVSVANAEKLPFKSGAFATVICNSTCEHITKDVLAIREMGRVLKKNGSFYLTVPSSFLPEMIFELERFEGNPKPRKAVNAFNKRVAHKHYHTLAEWKKILKKAGLEIENHKFYFPEPTTRVWYKRMRFSVSRLKGREMWSWIGHSRFTRIIPRNLIIWWLENFVLKSAFNQAFKTPEEVGGMLFLSARKS